jgi:hypothetical protein
MYPGSDAETGLPISSTESSAAAVAGTVLEFSVGEKLCCWAITSTLMCPKGATAATGSWGKASSRLLWHRQIYSVEGGAVT